jgi:peptide/nickel transport system substrate-binding protein
MSFLTLTGRNAVRTPLFAAAAVLTLAGAAFAAGTFVTAIFLKPTTLDLAASYDRYGSLIEFSIYEPLVAFAGKSADSGFVPALSTEVPSKENGLISRDGRTYIFPLRKNVKFHDGSPLTAGDAAYSLIRFMITDAPSGPSSLFLKPLLGINSVRGRDGNITPVFKDFTDAVRTDGDRLIITLKEPFPPFLALLASRPFITSQAWAAAHDEWDGTEANWKRFSGVTAESSRIRYLANGTGPFKLENVDPESGRIALVRNEHYWRAPASLNRLIFVPVDSESSRLAMIEGGDIDYAEFGRANISELSAMKGVTIEEGLQSQALTAITFNFRINMDKNPLTGSGALDGKGVPPDFFANSDVRKGFAYALNYDKMLSALWRSKAERITSPIPRPGAPARTFFPYDLKEAEFHFTKAFSGKLWEKGFYFVLPYPTSNPKSQEAVELIAEALKKVNPLFIIRPQPIHRLDEYIIQARQYKMPMFWSGFEPDYPDSYNYAFAMMHSEGLLPKFQGYSNPKADALCDEILRKEGPEREKALVALDKIYADDVPYILMFSETAFKTFRKGITGVSSDNWLLAVNNLPDYYRIVKP